MKKYFFTGFITLLPLALTLAIAIWLFDLFTAPVVGLTEALIVHFEQKLGLGIDKYRTLALILSRLIAFVFLLILLVVLGACGQKYFHRFLLKILDRVFQKIPLVRTIYRLSHDITKALFSDTKKTFRETVLIPFPHKEAFSLGFVTGNTPERFKQAGMPFTELAVFVPTAPHPMSGFVLLTPKTLTFPLDISVEDAFKFLISCGVIDPGAPLKNAAAPKPQDDL